MSNLQIVLVEPARQLLVKVGGFLVNILLVIFVLVVGWLIAKGVRFIFVKFFRTIKFDEISDQIGLDAVLEKGGISYSLSELLGVVFYWLTMLVTFMVAIEAVGLTVAAGLLDKIVLYVPNIIAAIFIIILGMFVASLLRNIILTAANNAGLAHGKLLSKVAETIIGIFVVIMALEQLQIAISVTQMTLGIILGALGLGAALAFGLGCKDLAGKYVADMVDKLKKK